MSFGSPELRGHAPSDQTFFPHAGGVYMGNKVFVGDAQSSDGTFPVDMVHSGKVLEGSLEYTEDTMRTLYPPFLGDDRGPFVQFHTKGEDDAS